MTRYTVTYHPAANQDLARIWLAAHDRNAVTASSDQIDRELANDPDQKGEDIGKGLRQMTVPPLRVVYQVREMDRIVEVMTIDEPSSQLNGITRLPP